MSGTGSGSKFIKIIGFVPVSLNHKRLGFAPGGCLCTRGGGQHTSPGSWDYVRVTCPFADGTGLWGRGAHLGQHSSMASEALDPKKQGPQGLGRKTRENRGLLFTQRRGWKKNLTIPFPANHTMTILWELITEIIPTVNLSVKGVHAS